ncbi:MAG TPA: hypothetical protein VMR18_03005 [Candidatus Saccharimonadales bacterium]|nr:hypothetical protein [Candidatus Saccharimonadales bacterium]
MASLRTVLVWDKQPTASPPMWQDVFLDLFTDGTSASISESGRNPNNYDRFEILWEKYDGVAGPDSGGTSNNVTTDQARTIDVTIPLLGRKTNIIASSGACASGALLFMSFCSDNAGTPAWQGMVSVDFIDN